MVISFLQGGTGNQLFQIAASIGQAELYGDEWKVQGDFIGRGHFNIPEEKYIEAYGLERYKEPSFHYQQIPVINAQLFGYWQTEKYFKTSQKLIRHLFECPYSEKIKWKYRELLEKNTCAVHVRRGDYLTLSEYHYNLELEYYDTAMRRLKLLMPDIHFVCFSDDISWCRENIKADTFIKDKDFTEFHLMTYCKHYILANSSWSWWGSWLSTNKEKIVIAPPRNKWFGKLKSHFIVDDLYCENWMYE